MTPILFFYVLASVFVVLALAVDHFAGKPGIASPSACVLMVIGNGLAVLSLLALCIAWVIG